MDSNPLQWVTIAIIKIALSYLTEKQSYKFAGTTK